MRSLFRRSIHAPFAATVVLVALRLFAAGVASAGSTGPSTAAVDSAASEPVAYVQLDLRFDRVQAKLDREVDLQLRPTTMDCSNRADASGTGRCVVRLAPADLAAAPASPALP